MKKGFWKIIVSLVLIFLIMLTSCGNKDSKAACYISANGDIWGDYQSTVDRLYGVRPACWINL